jgi:hypothetical protein
MNKFNWTSTEMSSKVIFVAKWFFAQMFQKKLKRVYYNAHKIARPTIVFFLKQVLAIF